MFLQSYLIFSQFFVGYENWIRPETRRDSDNMLCYLPNTQSICQSTDCKDSCLCGIFWYTGKILYL